MPRDVERLLRQLWSLNEKDDIRQSRDAPLRRPGRIAALAPGTTQALSPMLRARFAFADAWRGAALGQTWLGLSGVATATALHRNRACHHAHMEVLGCTFPEGIRLGRIVLFGLDEAKGGATYLVWCADEAEPVVCAFYADGLDAFTDLTRYLEFLVGERTHDDSSELVARRQCWPAHGANSVEQETRRQIV